MRKVTLVLLASILMAAFLVQPTMAQLVVGQTAPDFTKNKLSAGGQTGELVSLYGFTDEDAVVLYLLGWN
jgi:hypothetical protein